MHFKSVVNELIWFLSGDTNTQWLRENGVSIWDEWATEEGELGPSMVHSGTRGQPAMAAALIRLIMLWTVLEIARRAAGFYSTHGTSSICRMSV